jgi:hypothetical protein
MRTDLRPDHQLIVKSHMTHVGESGRTASSIGASGRTVPGWFFPLVVVAGYLALGIIAYWSAISSGKTRLFGTSSDSILATWFLAWVPHALAHGVNPFFSNAMFVPTGVNLAQNTEAPLLGALTVPLAAVLGPIARANVLMVLAMPVSATSAYYVLRRWNVWWPSAALGGLVYGFSPYMVGQGLGHLVLVFSPWLPLIALTLWKVVEERGRPFQLGLELGLLIVAQYFTEPEVLMMVAIVAVVALVAIALRHPAGAAVVLRRLLCPGAVAVGLAGVVLAYPVWMALAGPQHYTGAPQGITNPYHNDLFSFFVPGPLQRVSFGLQSLGSRLVAGNDFETNGYLGIPLVIAGGFFAWRSRRHGRTQLALLCFITSAVLSLGPQLSINGHRTAIRLPFAVLTHIPLIKDIVPVRFSLLTGASLAAIVAFGLDDLRRTLSVRTEAQGESRPRTQRRALARQRAVAGIAAAFVLLALTVTQVPRWPYSSQSVAALPSTIRHTIPSGDPVSLTYPYAQQSAAAALDWQISDDYRFRLLGGYAEHPELLDAFYVFPARMHPNLLQRFLANQEGFTLYGPAPPLNATLIASTRLTLREYDVRVLIVDRSAPGSAAAMRLLTAALGHPSRTSGSFAIWSSPTAPL